MSCEHPLLAVNLGKTEEGTYKIKILPRRVDQNLLQLEEKYQDDLLLLPCGCCAACKEAHKRQWSVRCSLEAMYYKDNCMVTLTYREDRRPRKLIKRDLQQFIKDLRNRGLKFRYFACGEYGKGANPHFHIILFGYWPDDAIYYSPGKSGYPMYGSKFLESIWKNGFITVSEMSPGTAAYVAGYVDKKLGQDEFVLMSKRPGIGERYLKEHLFDIFAYDNIVGAFGIARVPRYAEKLAEKELYDLEDLKAKRKKASNYGLIESMLNHSFRYKEEAIQSAGEEIKRKHERRSRL